MADLSPEQRLKIERGFVKWLAVLSVLLAFLPALYAIFQRPAGSSYLGFEYNTDDHMVYAAWMRQAMNGRFFFDNRFTTIAQPGLTVHLYFFALGLLAKLIGIPLAMAVGRAVFGLLFVFLAYRLVSRLNFSVYGVKLALALTIFGGGLGFMLWRNFGTSISKPVPDFLSNFLHGGLPTDIWQPEGFVFPSMLTNGLFMVSLCLILYVFLCILDAKEGMRSVLPGFLAIGVLMNIHSYDVLTIGLVMCGFLAASLVRGQVTAGWIGRAVLIALGVVIPALWFVHVLQSDTVFQARAATETYSPNFRQVLFGYLGLMVVGIAAISVRVVTEKDAKLIKRRMVGAALIGGLFVGLTVGAAWTGSGYFLPLGLWVPLFLLAVAGVALCADEEPAWNLIVSWAVVGTFAIYFPGLFQRKLTMGLSIPWAILSAYAVETWFSRSERSARNLGTVLVLIVFGATSIRWLFRDMQFARLNVSNTTRHPVYLSPDMQKMIAYLNDEKGRNVLLAVPGAGSPSADADTHQPIPDAFESPALPDVAPILSGLTGVYSYAGHWSETPDYGKKAGDMYRFFLKEPFQSVHSVMSDEERKAFVADTGATYASMPNPATFTALPLVSPASLGSVVYSGNQFVLVKLNR